MTGPGRHCPLHYRTRAADLRHAPRIDAETLYVIGGLYGNWWALQAIFDLARAEVRAGRPGPVLVFNGDFNWFNAEPAMFDAINAAVLQHNATLGNVEAELAQPSSDAGCGCAYPPWVDDATVARSNAIMERLQTVAAGAPGVRESLGSLPRQLAASVGGCRIGIVHGDPESVAGWGLAVEAMPTPGTCVAGIAGWFEDAAVDVIACTHTCLPFLQDFRAAGGRRLVLNNGAAGMPNFRGDRRGVITRISRVPSPETPLYGTRVGDLYCDALGVEWACAAWERWFDATWPEGSPAAVSYRGRLTYGPDHDPSDAMRLS